MGSATGRVDLLLCARTGQSSIIRQDNCIAPMVLRASMRVGGVNGGAMGSGVALMVPLSSTRTERRSGGSTDAASGKSPPRGDDPCP